MLAQGAATLPVGAVRIAVTGGTITTPSNTVFAVPLSDTPVALGASSARIVAVTANSVSLANAAWTVGAFAPASRTYAARFLTGPIAGLVLPVTGNTADTLVLRGPDLTALGLVLGGNGDAVELFQLATLDSVFGPATLIGGASPAVADIVTLGTYTQDKYYYNTTVGQWRRITGPALDRGGVVIAPGAAIQITRVGPAMTLAFLGRAPSTPFRASVLCAGNTLIQTGYPIDVRLRDFAVQTLVSDWAASADLAAADTLSVVTGDVNLTFFHNGSHWVQAAAPAMVEDDRIIRAGTAILLTRRGGVPGFTMLVRPLPYSL